MVEFYCNPEIKTKMWILEDNLSEIEMVNRMLTEIMIEMQERLITCLGDGEQFGEQSLFRNIPAIASVRTAEDSHFAVIEEENF